MGKKLILKENILKLIKESEEVKTTRYSFMTGAKEFIKKIMDDPGCENTEFFKVRGISKNKLISLMISKEILFADKKKMTDNGTFSVKYGTGDNLKQKLRKLYIKLFEKDKPLTEDEGGMGAIGDGGLGGSTTSASSGAYEAPLFGQPIKKKMPNELLETSLGDVGDISYDAPITGDDETLNHKNLVDRSIEDGK